MCGIAGVCRARGGRTPRSTLLRMAGALQHRGPDGYGIFDGRSVGLAHTRLAIIDPTGGAQPITNEDGSLVVAYNGEIYNHVELRRQLEMAGHRFSTRCDTEVLVHGWEEWGEGLLERLNGQFAFALYDRGAEELVLARDRFGIRPLFFAELDGRLYFASEIKALLASGEVSAAPDWEGLDEVFTFWAARAPRTPFHGIRQLEPGTLARWRNGALRVRRYYRIDFHPGDREDSSSVDALDHLMRTSVGLRMRADVPVGGYLSGGLDSSISSSLAADESPFALQTFAVTFKDPQLDESAFQTSLATKLGSMHRVVRIGNDEIGGVFPAVVRHAETPLVRTAPAPLFLLSRLTRDSGIKVVLTGEGADELFFGYDLFKETRIRRFCLRQPHSAWRPRLFDRLYPYLGAGGTSGAFWQQAFLRAGDADDPLFSHMPRFLLTSWIKEFYTGDVRDALGSYDAMDVLRDDLPAEFGAWTDLGRAAYLEMNTLLAGYLLSSQGDRMAMAHSVEGRFPFLDHELFEFAASLPDGSKLRTLREKDILRRWASRILPTEFSARPKQPYRAPDVPAFFGAHTPDYVPELLSPTSLARTGVFDPQRVSALIRRCETGRATGFRENQALVAILSTQLWHAEFMADPYPAVTHQGPPDVLLREDDAGMLVNVHVSPLQTGASAT